MLPTNHVIDLIPGYALDCLNEEEKLQVTEHLAQCASCQVRVGFLPALSSTRCMKLRQLSRAAAGV